MTTNETTDRRGLRIMSREECLRMLRSARLGRIGFVHDGDPEVLPVTFGMDGDAPVFRTTWGAKLDAAMRGHAVALEVDSVHSAVGRACSVVVKGSAVVEYDEAAIARYESLRVPAWADPGTDTFWVRVRPDSITGRQLNLG
jgi:nitroimidazol reductase NimA-like FMN-containing flavoprotein (pyridoxamine 5'-phosphate oxidase superfamily)